MVFKTVDMGSIPIPFVEVMVWERYKYIDWSVDEDAILPLSVWSFVVWYIWWVIYFLWKEYWFTYKERPHSVLYMLNELISWFNIPRPERRIDRFFYYTIFAILTYVIINVSFIVAIDYKDWETWETWKYLEDEEKNKKKIRKDYDRTYLATMVLSWIITQCNEILLFIKKYLNNLVPKLLWLPRFFWHHSVTSFLQLLIWLFIKVLTIIPLLIIKIIMALIERFFR